MTRRFNPSPAQLSLLTVLGGVLVACGFAVLVPYFPHFSSRNPAQLRIGLVLFVIGFPLWLRSLPSLKDGLQNHRWPPEQIEPLYAIFESPWSRTFTWPSLAVVFALLAAVPGTNSALPAVVLIQILIQLRQAVKRPPPPRAAFNRRNYPPLRSQHWGEK